MSSLPRTRPAIITDDATGATYQPAGPTGAIHMRAPLTWTGVREYPQIRVGNRPARILRRPEQVFRPGYLRTIERITPTLGHPKNGQGQSMLITPENYKMFSVGSVGDKIDREEIEGYPVPVGNISVIDAEAIATITAGDDQVSQGFYALISPPPNNEARPADDIVIGVWEGPHGPEKYDYEHICDPEDPRAYEYAKIDPDFRREQIGANHIAVGIPKGRGLAQAQGRPVFDSIESPAGGAILFLDDAATAEATTVKTNVYLPKLQSILKGVKLSAGKTLVVPCFDEMPVPVEEADSPEVAAAFAKIAELFGMLANELAGAQAETGEAEAAAATAGEATEAAQGEAAAAAVQTAEAVQAADELKTERDALLAEVKPLRVAALASLKAIATKVAPGVVLDELEDAPSVRKAAVVAKVPALADAPDGAIQGAWAVLVEGMDAAPIVETPEKPSPGFMAVVEGGKAPASRAQKMFAPKGSN